MYKHRNRTDAWTSLWYRLHDPKVALFSSLGLINPASIAWEVMRYSFVVDWFLPIGPWLNSWTADAGWSFLSGTRSTKSEASMSQEIAAYPEWNRVYDWPHSYDGSIAPILKRADSSVFERVVLTHRPVPGLFLKNPLSASHAISAIALLRSAFR